MTDRASPPWKDGNVSPRRDDRKSPTVISRPQSPGSPKQLSPNVGVDNPDLMQNTLDTIRWNPLDKHRISWVLYGHADWHQITLINKDVSSVAKVEDFVNLLEDDQVMYGFLRLPTISDVLMVKFVYIHWVGQCIDPSHKARAMMVRQSVEAMFKPFHDHIETGSKEAVQLDRLYHRLGDARARTGQPITSVSPEPQISPRHYENEEEIPLTGSETGPGPKYTETQGKKLFSNLENHPLQSQDRNQSPPRGQSVASDRTNKDPHKKTCTVSDLMDEIRQHTPEKLKKSPKPIRRKSTSPNTIGGMQSLPESHVIQDLSSKLDGSNIPEESSTALDLPAKPEMVVDLSMSKQDSATKSTESRTLGSYKTRSDSSDRGAEFPASEEFFTAPESPSKRTGSFVSEMVSRAQDTSPETVVIPVQADSTSSRKLDHLNTLAPTELNLKQDFPNTLPQRSILPSYLPNLRQDLLTQNNYSPNLFSTNVQLVEPVLFQQLLLKIRSNQGNAAGLSWILYGHHLGDHHLLALVGRDFSKMANAEDFISLLEDDQVMYGLIRLTSSSAVPTSKLIYVHWLGGDFESVSKARLAAIHCSVEDMFKPFHDRIETSSREDLQLEALCRRMGGIEVGTSTETALLARQSSPYMQRRLVRSPSPSVLEACEPDALAAIDSVRDDVSALRWVVLGLNENDFPLVLVAKGRGSIEEMKRWLQPDQVQFVLYRLHVERDGIKIIKFASLLWVGSDRPVVKSKAILVRAVERLFNTAHISISFTDIADVSDEIIREKVLVDQPMDDISFLRGICS